MESLSVWVDALFAWCYQSPLLAPIRDTRFGMPVAQSLHIFGFTVLLGSCVAFNLRLTGLGFREIPLQTLTKDLWRWARGGLWVVVVSGVMVFAVDPVRYAANGPFRAKMLLLIVAVLFHFNYFKSVVKSDQSFSMSLAQRWGVAATSLALWFGVGWAGRFIAFL